MDTPDQAALEGGAHEVAPPSPSQQQLEDLAAAVAEPEPQAQAQVLLDAALAAADGNVLVSIGSTSVENDDDEDDLVRDSKRNWSHDVTLKLVKTWRRVCQEHPNVGRIARLQMVYDEFKEAVDCSNRSRKAVEDKLYTLKQMYHFIVKMNGTLTKPGANANRMPTWFSLSKEERRSVRSLHRIRIPNISLEVFYVLDSVLNPNPAVAPSISHQRPVLGIPAATPSSTVVSTRAVTPSVQTPSPSRDSKPTTPFDSESAEVVDGKRNWSQDVTIQLAKAWSNAVRSDRDLRGATLSQRVYTEFMQAVGGSSRSRKAIEDKMHSMKEMYRFIRMHDASCPPESGRRVWFELSKPERRQLRALHKIRVPNLTPEVYAVLDTFLTQSEDTSTTAMTPTMQLIQATAMLQDPPALAGLPEVSGNASSRTEAQNFELLRRLAEEESQLSPMNLTPTSSDQQDPPPRPDCQAQTPVEKSVSSADAERDASIPTPAFKRARTHGPLTTDQRLERLFELQQLAIAERRQQHMEQMALLREIARMLQPRVDP